MLLRYFILLLFLEISWTIQEREEWKLERGGKYYTTRNGSSLVAFVIGSNYVTGNGAGIIATHIDALCVKLKPTSIKKPIDGYTLLGVAPYSGALNRLWVDRDLSIGGRVLVKSSSGITQKLMKFSYPVAHIPSLAPHFGLSLDKQDNKETQMIPIIGLEPENSKINEPSEKEKSAPLFGKHNLMLLRAISKELDVEINDILEIELELFDIQKASIGGLNQEFLFAPRLDDKLNSFAAIEALINTSDDYSNKGSSINMVGMFDNEEIGSLTRQGAQGNLLDSVLQRINNVFNINNNNTTNNIITSNTTSNDAALMNSLDLKHKLNSNSNSNSLYVMYAKSFLISSDVTHAVNPNFSDVYLEHHKPKLNFGMTIKCDENGHVITDAVSKTFVNEIGLRCGSKLQLFHIRNGTPSGSTVGPFISSSMGIRGVDMGICQLSMHSIRAMTGSKDIYLAIKFFIGFFTEWEDVDSKMATCCG